MSNTYLAEPPKGISDVYLAEPPVGEVRSFTDPPSRFHDILAVAIATTTVAAVAVCVRFYTRIHIVGGRISLDDTFALFSLFMTITSIVINFKHSQHGLGTHKWDILYDEYNIGYPVYAIVGTCTYSLSITFAKLSILLFYLRLSPQQWFRTLVYGLMAVVSSFSLVYILLNVFPCRPVAAAWDMNIEESTCIDPWNAYWALSILNILMDLATLLLPIPVVVHLNIPTRQKVSLCMLFATGIFVCAIATRRTALIPHLINTDDRPWDVVQDYVFSYLEVNAGIICASVPALKPFFLRFLPAIIGTHTTNRARTTTKSKSYGLATVTEQNRQRRMMQHGSYELSSVDHHNKHFEKRADDDEVKLWSPNRKDEESRIIMKSKNSSLGSLQELSVTARGVNETTVAAQPAVPVQGGVIQVQHETVIDYGR